MAQKGPSVRWSESARRWMAWVRFPDGSRRKAERINKADAQRDLDELLARRASAETPGPRRQRLATFGEVIDAWMVEGCPTAAPSSRGCHARTKSPNTIANIRYLLKAHVRPEIGKLWVDRTTTERLEAVFRKMAAAGYATSTIHHTWLYLNQACRTRFVSAAQSRIRRPTCCCPRPDRPRPASRSRSSSSSGCSSTPSRRTPVRRCGSRA